MKINTQAIHAGSHVINQEELDISPAIHLSTTFLRESDGGYQGHVYTRAGNPNRDVLQARLATLEGADQGIAFASGLAAAHSIMQALPKPCHIIMSDDLYHGSRCLLEQMGPVLGIEVSQLDLTDHDHVADQLSKLKQQYKDHHLALWLESPTNPKLKVLDIKHLATLIHAHQGICICDNTVATPVLCRPLSLGADVVFHSSTKYIGGHSDVLGGIVVINQSQEMYPRIRNIQTLAGAVPSPFDCWLLLRSLATLPCRMRQHSDNAKALAEFLSAHPQVDKVYYPGLATHPQYPLAQQQMPQGASGLLSFETPVYQSVLEKIRLFKRATSLGGVESLIEHRASVAGESSTIPKTLLRVSVGIEHIDDLMDDLDHALS